MTRIVLSAACCAALMLGSAVALAAPPIRHAVASDQSDAPRTSSSYFQQVTWPRPWLPDRGYGFYASRPYPGYYVGSYYRGPYYYNGSWNGGYRTTYRPYYYGPRYY